MGMECSGIIGVEHLIVQTDAELRMQTSDAITKWPIGPFDVLGVPGVGHIVVGWKLDAGRYGGRLLCDITAPCFRKLVMQEFQPDHGFAFLESGAQQASDVAFPEGLAKDRKS